MNRPKSCIAMGLVLAAVVSCPVAMADVNGAGEGYYYISHFMIDGDPTTFQSMKVGPFAEEADCVAAMFDDQTDDNDWYPYYGTGIQCDWIYANEVGALNDAIDHWNNPISNGGNPPGQLDAAKLRAISILRDEYDIEGYEAGVKAILAPRR